jgi:hypothetical protein
MGGKLQTLHTILHNSHLIEKEFKISASTKVEFHNSLVTKEKMCTINLKSNLLAMLSRTVLGASTLPTLGLLLMQLPEMYDSVPSLPYQR